MGSTRDSSDRRSGPSDQQHQQRNRNVQHDVSAEVGQHGRQQARFQYSQPRTTPPTPLSSSARAITTGVTDSTAALVGGDWQMTIGHRQRTVHR